MNKHILSSIFKLVVTFSLLVYCAFKINLKGLESNFLSFSNILLGFLLLVQLIQMLCYHLRYYYLIRLATSASNRITFSEIAKMNWGVVFLSQLLPGGSVLGDMMKLKFMNDYFNIPLREGVVCFLLERVLMLALLFGIAFLTVFFLPIEFYLYKNALLKLAFSMLFLSLCVATFLSMKNYYSKKLAQVFRALIKRIKVINFISMWSIIIYFLSYVVIATMCLHFNEKINVLTLLPITSLILIITALPFSFAGWGAREGGCIIILPLIGLTSDQAITISITFGILQFLSAVPGLYYGASLLWNFGSDRELKRFSALKDKAAVYLS